MSTGTPSLRRRLIIAVLALMAILLVLLGVTIDAVVGTQVRNDLHDRMMAAVSRADSLAAQGTPPSQIVTDIAGGGIRARIVTTDGTGYGDPAVPDPPPGAADPAPQPPAPPGPAGGPPRRPGPPAPPPPPANATATTIDHQLATGDRLILNADTTAITALLRQLRLIVVVSSVAVLLVAALGVTFVVNAAMSPLQRLAAVAGSITSGDRGRRLRPDRPGTDLGRAASAFDTMLDALEESEKRAHAAAADAERANAATRQFLADAAHELRTPIAGIHAGAQQIVAAALQDPDQSTGTGTGTAQRRRAELVLGEARRAGRLVSDMLDLSRIDAGSGLDLQTCDLVDLVEAERQRVAVLAPSVHTVRSGANSVPLAVDPSRIQQILANLGDNARRHTSRGGEITFDIGVHGGCAIVTVTDTGIGVPDDQRERIFERLVRLDDARARDHGGAGLGLPIARALARAHGGTLTCDPNPTGAQFTLRIPIISSSNLR